MKNKWNAFKKLFKLSLPYGLDDELDRYIYENVEEGISQLTSDRRDRKGDIDAFQSVLVGIQYLLSNGEGANPNTENRKYITSRLGIELLKYIAEDCIQGGLAKSCAMAVISDLNNSLNMGGEDRDGAKRRSNMPDLIYDLWRKYGQSPHQHICNSAYLHELGVDK